MIHWPRRLRIRPLMAADAALWRDLRLEAMETNPEAYGATHDDWAGRPLSDFADQLDAGHLFGAFRAGGLVGSMALDISADGGEISAVYVRPGDRGRGAARAMFKALRSVARQRGVQRLSLTVAQDNAPALRFYETSGFHPTGLPSRALARDGRLLDLITMTMVL